MRSWKILAMAAAMWCAAGCLRAQTWVQTSAPVTNWAFVACSADGSRVAATVFPGGIWISTNSGGVWRQTSAPTEDWGSIASSADGSHLIAEVAGAAFLSTNFGATWIAPSGLQSPKSTGWVASGGTGAILETADTTTSYSATSVSTNGGSSWNSTISAAGIDAIALSADGSKALAAQASLLTVSTNFGASFASLYKFPQTVYSIASSANGNCIAVLAGSSIYVSTNSGLNWALTSAPATNWTALASSADGSWLVAVGDAGTSESLFLAYGLIYSSTNWGAAWQSNSVPAHGWGAVACSADGGKTFAIGKIPGASLTGTNTIWRLERTAPPAVSCAPQTNGSVAVSWIEPSTNFVVQQSADLSHWVQITNQPALNPATLQSQISVPAPAAGSNVFFRLRTP